ncbi:MAG: hypothetical protein C0424_02090 [Sphingobacteriaceae bacterium]|nr:hypothetical protein [Sphingobacteriaceae bacterium]
MKHTLLEIQNEHLMKIRTTLFFSFLVGFAWAQQPVVFKGQINNLKAAETIFLEFDDVLKPLELQPNGAFELIVNVPSFPATFNFSTISKKGKITRKTPLIWFESDSLFVNVNWSDGAFEMGGKLPYQSLSEELEALKGKEQMDQVLKYAKAIPGLYFANALKEKMAIADLETFLTAVPTELRDMGYVKEMENYLRAQKIGPLKKGSNVQDFQLPDSAGNRVSILQNSGRKQLVALVSTGCYHSLGSLGMLQQLAESNEKQYEIITIWDDGSKDIWLNARKEQKSKITWTNLWDEYGFATTYFGMQVSPSFYVIDENGILLEVFKGYNEKIASKIKRALK